MFLPVLAGRSHERSTRDFEEHPDFLNGDVERSLSPAIAAEAASTMKTSRCQKTLVSAQSIES
jgi:hypothetical protein